MTTRQTAATTATAKHLVGVGAAREQKGGREAAAAGSSHTCVSLAQVVAASRTAGKKRSLINNELYIQTANFVTKLSWCSVRQAEAHLGRILILNFTKVDLNPMKYKLNIWAAIVVLVLVAAAPVWWPGVMTEAFFANTFYL